MALPITTSSRSSSPSISSLYTISMSPNFPANLTRKQVRMNQKGPRGNKATCRAFGQSHDGKLVDEDMIVLRMRIRELTKTDDVAPRDWMEWERKYYAENYDSDVCEALGFLQSQLMNTRPSFALAILALFSISVPISLGFLLLHFLDVAKEAMVVFHI